MKRNLFSKLKSTYTSTHAGFFLTFFFLFIILFFLRPDFFSSQISYQKNNQIEKIKTEKKLLPVLPPLDTVTYDKKLDEIANNLPTLPKVGTPTSKNVGAVPVAPAKINLWPVHTVYPNAGAILPFHRVVAYYGNLYSKQMGVLGEYPEDEMFAKLDAEVKKWNVADPFTPVVPALHYIAVVAQESPGDGKYRFRMPGSEIEKVIAMARKINAIVFLDIQVGFSTLQNEVPLLEKYLKMPQVHLGIDPEFSMKGHLKPGKIVGTFDAEDINFTADYLAKIVKENNLTPKILVVHRYTQKMVTNYKQIKILPEVQIVMNMDGWGEKAKKLNTYKQFIYKESVLFTGFKLFYKNDTIKEGNVLMTPEDLLKLNPQPVYIQYQ